LMLASAHHHYTMLSGTGGISVGEFFLNCSNVF